MSHPSTEGEPLFDPGLWPSLRRRLWLPVLLAILLGAGGAYLGQKRTPTFTAVNRLTIGSVNYRTQSVPGFVTAAQTLAQSYGFVVVSQAVLGPLARSRHTSVAALSNEISSTAVPNSTLFSIKAKSKSGAEAISLVNAAAQQAKTTIGRLNTTTSDENHALSQYRLYSHQAAVEQQKLGLLRAQRRASITSVSLARIANQQTFISEAKAKANAYSLDYEEMVGGNTPQNVARLVSVVIPATTANSDKRTYLERYILFGIAAGIAAGVLLALIIPRRRKAAAAP